MVKGESSSLIVYDSDGAISHNEGTVRFSIHNFINGKDFSLFSFQHFSLVRDREEVIRETRERKWLC